MTDATRPALGARARGLALLVAVFAAGVVTGLAADRTFGPRNVAQARLTTRMPQILARLQLSPDQRRAVDSILERSSPRAEAAMREMIPRLAAIADSVHAEVASVLTPEQRAKFDSLRGRELLMLKRRSAGGGGERVDTVFHR